MGQPYVGEIRMFGGNFPPAGWAFCEGQLLAIAENDVLFTLIGTTYGGDGQSTFAVPDLRSRVPLHNGTGSDGINYVLGQTAGVESVTLTVNQIPVHTHSIVGTRDSATKVSPAGNRFGSSPAVNYKRETNPNTTLNAQSLSPVGGSQPHENMQPFLVISFIISLYGIYPQQP